jgi:hypothetical protein
MLEAHIVQLIILLISAHKFIKMIENTRSIQKITYYLYAAQMFYIRLCPKDWWEIHLFARNNLSF